MVVSAWLQLPDSGSGSDPRPMTSGSDTDPTLSPGVSPREGACHHRTVGQNSCLEAWKKIFIGICLLQQRPNTQSQSLERVLERGHVTIVCLCECDIMTKYSLLNKIRPRGCHHDCHEDVDDAEDGWPGDRGKLG